MDEERDDSVVCSLEELKNSPIGKALNKLFKAGFVNTIDRHDTLEAIQDRYSIGIRCWDKIVFGDDDECKKVFYMFRDRDCMSGHGERVSIKYILSL